MKQLLLLLAVALFHAESYAQLSATTSTTTPDCIPNNNGSATVVPSGGSNYTYKWSNGATTATINGLTAGTYTVTVYSGTAGGVDTVYTQTFEGAHNWSLNDATGVNDSYANFWEVTDAEGGVLPPGCGVATNGNKTLYVTNSLLGGGATYFAGGLCGSNICVVTNKAASSPNISTLGQSNLKLHFDFIGNGQGLSDNASLLYSINGGGSYVTLDASLKSTVCGSGQGQWTHRGYSLPVSCNNISNLKIRFNWTNNDDGAGSDPSFAVNNVFIIDSGAMGSLDSVVTTAVVPANQGIHLSLTNVVNDCDGAGSGSITTSVSGNMAAPLNNQWTYNGNVVASGTYVLTNLTAGNYRCIQTNGQGCADTLDVVLENYHFEVYAQDSTICWNQFGTFYFDTNLDTVEYLATWAMGTDTLQFINSTGNNVINCFTAVGGGCTINDCAEVYVQGPYTPVPVSSNGSWVYSTEVGEHYQWLFNGNPIPNSDTIAILITQAGTYTVNVYDAGGCGETGFIVIDDISESDGSRLFLYPNPTCETLWLVLQNGDNASFSICDLNGRLMLQSIITVPNFQVDVSRFPAGIYLLKAGDTLQRFEVISK